MQGLSSTIFWQKCLCVGGGGLVVLDVDVRRPLTALARPSLTLNGKSCQSTLIFSAVTYPKWSEGLSLLCVVPEGDICRLPETGSVPHEVTCARISFVWSTSSKGLRIFDRVQRIVSDSFLLSVSLFVNTHEESQGRSTSGCCSNVVGWAQIDTKTILLLSLALHCTQIAVRWQEAELNGLGEPLKRTATEARIMLTIDHIGLVFVISLTLRLWAWIIPQICNRFRRGVLVDNEWVKNSLSSWRGNVMHSLASAELSRSWTLQESGHPRAGLYTPSLNPGTHQADDRLSGKVGLIFWCVPYRSL